MPSNKIDESRERLIAGAQRFQHEVYPQRKAEYQQLILEGQKPHLLFITCADSRIDPERGTAPDEPATFNQLIEENVVLQLQHLRTHPSVAGRLAEGTLGLSGWVYDIGHGAVHTYDEAQRKFLPVTPDERATSGNASK